MSQLQFAGEHDRLAFFEGVVVEKHLVPAFVEGESASTRMRLFATEAGYLIEEVYRLDVESFVAAWLAQFADIVRGLAALLAPPGQALGLLEYLQTLHSSAGKAGGGMLVQVAIAIQQTTFFKQNWTTSLWSCPR